MLQIQTETHPLIRITLIRELPLSTLFYTWTKMELHYNLILYIRAATNDYFDNRSSPGTVTLSWWRGLRVPGNLGAVLSGALCSW